MSSTFTPPATYKAMSVTKKGAAMELVDVKWKEPLEGQIVVKVLACGVCRSDDLVVDQVLPTGMPRIPGHEIIGEIVSIHPSEKIWKIGQRVGGGWHGGHCYSCVSCRGGDYATCQNEKINGINIDGGYAEFATLHSEAAARIPDDMDPAETAPLMCAGVTTFNSIRHMGIEAGDVVAVQGIGGLGHLAIQYCRAMGFHTVALSTSASKEKLAIELGAHSYIDGSKVDQAEELQKLGGAKLVVATAPHSAIMQALVGGMAVGGTLLVLAITEEPLQIPSFLIVPKRLTVRGWPSGMAKDSEECIRFSKLANVKCQVQTFPLSKANEAFKAMMDGSVTKFRAVLVP